jgi:branched-chain amino acid transport system permease protein
MRRALGVVLGGGAAVALPLVAGDGYLTHLAISVLVFSMLASSLNLLMGYAGLVSIAHAAFFGIGGYASAILALKHGVPFWGALALAPLVTAVVALGIGLPSFRTRGIYYIIVTVAFQLIASEVFDNWYAMTGGGLGLRGVPRPGPVPFLPGVRFDTAPAYYYLVLVIAASVQALMAAIVRSPLGRTLMAVRDNETKALMLGLKPLGPKTLAFVVASAIAGLAGSLYVHYLQYANPEFFTFAVSVDVFLAVILGGVGTVWGPPFGVLVLEVVREVLHETVALRLLLFGVLLVVLIVFLPQGVLPPLARLARRLLPARASAARR